MLTVETGNLKLEIRVKTLMYGNLGVREYGSAEITLYSHTPSLPYFFLTPVPAER
jgi:hypothetical protein